MLPNYRPANDTSEIDSDVDIMPWILLGIVILMIIIMGLVVVYLLYRRNIKRQQDGLKRNIEMEKAHNESSNPNPAHNELKEVHSKPELSLSNQSCEVVKQQTTEHPNDQVEGAESSDTDEGHQDGNETTTTGA